MEEQFINYNQSLKIKELGFDEPCLGLYYGTSIKEVPEFLFEKRSSQYSAKKGFIDAVLAPLYQQAFKWFIEKYKLNGYISYSKSYDWQFIIDDIVSDDVVIEVLYFKTQEEAMLNCLDNLLEKASLKTISK